MINTRNHLLRDLENPPVDEEEKKREEDSSCDVLKGKPESKPSYTPGDTYRKVYELQGKLKKDPFRLPENQRDESGAEKRAQTWERCAVSSIVLVGSVCALTGIMGLVAQDDNKDAWIGGIFAGGSLLTMVGVWSFLSNKIAVAKPCLKKSRNFFFRKNVVPKLEASDREECQLILEEINGYRRFYYKRGDVIKEGINSLVSQMDSYEKELKEVVSGVMPASLADLTLNYLDVPAAVEEAFKLPKLPKRMP